MTTLKENTPNIRRSLLQLQTDLLESELRCMRVISEWTESCKSLLRLFIGLFVFVTARTTFAIFLNSSKQSQTPLRPMESEGDHRDRFRDHGELITTFLGTQ